MVVGLVKNQLISLVHKDWLDCDCGCVSLTQVGKKKDEDGGDKVIVVVVCCVSSNK